MRRPAAILLLAPLLICAAPKHHPAAPANPNAALFAKVRAIVVYGLKDPDSAKFRPFQLVTDTDGNKKVCGEVNSKNSYGGYVGYTAFAYTLELGNLIFAPDPDDHDPYAKNRAGSGCPGFGPWSH